MSASHFCCTHPQQRTDSPEPPPRPLTNIDGIFAAAALPDDHPHAIKFPDRKPGTDPDIVRSPGIASKIKMQFRRRSLKSLSKEKDYDEDAQRISSKEVLHEAANNPVDVAVDDERPQQHRFGSVVDVKSTTSPSGDAGTPQVRTSVLNSLGYLRPLIDKPSDLTMSDKPNGVSDIAIRLATRQHLVGTSSENERPLPPLPKSFSSPLLPSDNKYTLLPRRSRSLQIMGTSTTESSDGTKLVLTDRIIRPKETMALIGIPALHVQEPTDIESINVAQPKPAELGTSTGQCPEQISSDKGFHLHDMDISEQLRCMSQLSDVAEDEPYVASPYPWNFHRRERSDFEHTNRSRHSRQKSSSGIDSATLPASWGRVKTPFRDTSSSIYSRPTSAGANAMERQCSAMSDPKDNEQPVDLNNLFADWPLKPSTNTEVEVQRKLSTLSQKSAASEYRNKPLPPTPDDSQQQSSTASFVTAANNNDDSSPQWVSPQGGGSIQSKDSSSTLTRATKTSMARRFFGRFPPPTKFVTKRRSTFKFLRPSSRKQQGRSVSTPILSAKSAGCLDGPADDPAFLTVQYELTDNSTTATRSVSMSHLAQRQQDEINNQLLSPAYPQRRPTMVDYERNLSVAGDDRRKPSMVSSQRAKDIHDEDHRESMTVRRRLSRARALKDDASPLMAQALEKHQQEKALFRSASKARESMKSSRPNTISGLTFIGREGSEALESSIEEQDEETDPLSSPVERQASPRSISSTGLLSPQLAIASSSRLPSTAGKERVSSVRSSNAQGKQPVPTQKPRLGTSLDSWSRYPSHTRAQRCGPAGRADAVLTHDFALDINPEEIHVTDEIEPSSPISKKSTKIKVKRSKFSLPKSHSMTFSSIARYYSNIFHSSETAQNRRTSVSTGGRLSHPELEMLQPPSVEATSHVHSHWDPFERLKEDAHMIKDFAHAEEHKIGAYVRKEEDKFEGFVRKEEDTVEGFVKKEEVLFEDFMKKEEQKLKTYVEHEDKLLHHQHQHQQPDGVHLSSGRHSPFEEGSVFGSSHARSPNQMSRKDTMVGPMDDVEETSPPNDTSKTVDIGLALDGSHSAATPKASRMPSKADLWSGIYQKCILETPTPAIKTDTEATTMPPPSLKPTKPRSPEQPKQLDPKSTIRRFPSVTVIDDCKGHFRSVSLISVKTSKSVTFERSSTHDLLQLIQTREREEREKLLKNAEIMMSADIVDVI